MIMQPMTSAVRATVPRILYPQGVLVIASATLLACATATPSPATTTTAAVATNAHAPTTKNDVRSASPSRPETKSLTNHPEQMMYAVEAIRPAGQVDNANLSAPDLLQRMLDARAVWHRFPGFTADLVIRMESASVQTRLHVNAKGELSFEVDDPTMTKWAKGWLKMIVRHRMPKEESTSNAVYIDDDIAHPLGRAIRMQGDSQESVYRIDGDIRREVDRRRGNVRFNISMLEAIRNPEGKTLPSWYQVSFWDADTGEIKHDSLIHEQFVRVDGFDLPVKLTQIEVRRGVSEVRVLEFSNHQLAGSSAHAQR